MPLSAEDATLLVDFYDSLQEIRDIVNSWVDNQTNTADFNAWNVLMQKVQHNLSIGQSAVQKFCPEVNMTRQCQPQAHCSISQSAQYQGPNRRWRRIYPDKGCREVEAKLRVLQIVILSTWSSVISSPVRS